ncbi:MAG: hypothetical protein ABF379_16920 [Akkermansiaceae bacterium]
MFDSNHSAQSVRAFMESKSFDVVGVSVDGVPQGYVEKEKLSEGNLGASVMPFTEVTLLDEKTPLLEVLQALAETQYVFLRFLGTPSAIVTRSDLEKAPVRMWLFGLVSILEMELLQMIKDEGEGDWWLELLSAGRQAGAKKVHKLRMEKKEEISLADCLQICDKKEIFAKTTDLFAKTGFSKDEWSSFMVDLEDLRNNLAHANEMDTGSWPKKAELVLYIEQLIRRIESA